MSLSGNFEVNEFIDITNSSISDLTIKLTDDIIYDGDISWIYNRFISSNLYYKILDNLSVTNRQKFNILSKKTYLQTKSKLSYEELEQMQFDMFNDDKIDFEDTYEDMNDDDHVYDESLFTFKKTDKEVSKLKH